MWDSIISQSKVERLLPAGVLWTLEQLSFDGMTMQLRLTSKKECKAIDISFDPIYYSVSDDWVEDYGGMNGLEGQKSQSLFGSVDDIKKNIGEIFPEQNTGLLHKRNAVDDAICMLWSPKRY